jgi:hypothetical protein
MAWQGYHLWQDRQGLRLLLNGQQLLLLLLLLLLCS